MAVHGSQLLKVEKHTAGQTRAAVLMYRPMRVVSACTQCTTNMQAEGPLPTCTVVTLQCCSWASPLAYSSVHTTISDQRMLSQTEHVCALLHVQTHTLTTFSHMKLQCTHT